MRISHRKQLFQPIRNLTLFSHYSLGRIVTKDGDNMPHMMWPDGSPCLLANLYMLHLRDRPGRGGRQGLSRRGRKGGTFGEYASKVGQLIRFCYYKKTDLIDLSDDEFTTFINLLRADRATGNPDNRRKTETTVTAVGRTCLDFLSFVGSFYDDPSFVSAQGTIHAVQKTFVISNGDKKSERSYWHHHSFFGGERLKKRNPIPAENIEKLRDAVDCVGGTRFRQSRTHCMLSVLEQTGVRRAELVELKVSDVLSATAMEPPMLRVLSLKGGDREFRMIPVSRMLLSELKKHIDFSRSNVIRKRLGKINDHDYFFVSATTGKPISEGLVTSEISKLRKVAEIDEQACAHMFRHAFITNIFVRLISRHEFENPDDFRKALIGKEKFKREVMEWTGHRHPSSVDGYIDYAFAELAGLHIPAHRDRPFRLNVTACSGRS